MTSNVSSLGPSTGAQMGWSVTDSIKERLSLNSVSKNPKIELAKYVAKRAIDFSSDYVVPEILKGYFSPLVYLGMPTKAAVGILYNGLEALAHVTAAAKKTLDGDTTERDNHIKSAAKFGSRVVADGALFGVTTALGTPAILAISIANLIAPKQLREGTEKAFRYVDAKIGRVESKSEDALFRAGIRKINKKLKRALRRALRRDMKNFIAEEGASIGASRYPKRGRT